MLLLIIVPIFTLVMIFGVEWSYVERISREEADGGERSPIENNRKRAIMNNRSPLDLNNGDGKAAAGPDIQINPPRDSNYAELDRYAPSNLQKQARGNMSTGVFESLSQQSPNILADKAKLYEVLKDRKLYELRVEKSIREMWWYARDRVAMLDEGQKVAKETVKSLREQYDIMRWNFNNLKSLGGGSNSPIQLNWEYWQKNMSKEMAKLMERRLTYLQNPPDCALAKKLICEVAKTCGFGCQIHHVAYCFIMAYATKRTLILDARNWRYSMDGWEAVFQPISKTCTTASGENVCAKSKQYHANDVLLCNLYMNL